MLTREWGVEFFNEANIIKSILDKHRVKTVLDVGSGKGFLGYMLKPFGYKFTGTDIDCNGSLIPCVENDINNGLPFSEASFDAVVSQHVIEHFECNSIPFIISEMARVSKKLIVIITPNLRFKWKPPDGTFHEDHKCVMDKSMFSSFMKSVFDDKFYVREISNFMYISGRYYRFMRIIVYHIASLIKGKPGLLGVGYKYGVRSEREAL